MKKQIALILFGLILIPSHLLFADDEISQKPPIDDNYVGPTIPLSGYPLSSRERATVSTAFLSSYAPDVKTVSFVIRNDRSKVRFFEKRNRIDVGFLRAPHSTRLMILFPGLGANADAGLASYLGTKVQALGYNVLLLPNPLSWKFALGASRVGYPGYVPYDIEDLMPLVQKALSYFNKRYGLRLESGSVIGYSLGALYAGHFAGYIESHLGLRFEHAVMINSPVDVIEGANIIDGLYDIGNRFSENRKMMILGRIADIYMKGVKAVSVPEYAFFTGMNAAIPFSNRDVAWVIGNLFREDLAAIVYTSQQIQERNVLKSPVSWGHRTARQYEAKSFSFLKYISEVVAPWVMSEENVNDLNSVTYKAGLKSLSPVFKNDSRYVFFHTDDDFLTSQSSRFWAMRTFRERAVYYDHGGHVGQVWTNEFQTDLVNVLK